MRVDGTLQHRLPRWRDGLVAGFFALTLGACAPTPPPATSPQGGEARPARHLDRRQGLSFLKEKDRRRLTQGGRVLQVGAGAPGDRLFERVQLSARSCVRFLGRGARSVEDLDLAVYDGDGTPAALDERPDEAPTVTVCADKARVYYVALELAAGRGVMALGLEDVPWEAGRRVVAANAAAAHTLDAETPTKVRERLDARTRQLGAAWSLQRRFVLPVDVRLESTFSATVTAGDCIDVHLSPIGTVSHLAVDALDESGRIVGRAEPNGASRSLLACSPSTREITLRVRPHAGSGVVGVVLSQRKLVDADRDGDVLRDAGAPAPALARARKALHRRRPRGPAKAWQRKLVLGRREGLPLRLAAGCHRVDVVGGRPLRGLATTLWTDDGRRIAESSSAAAASHVVCGPAGTYRLDLEPIRRGGPVVVERRALRGSPAVIRKHPTAAARLGLLLDALGVPFPRASAAVDAADIRPDRLHRVAIRVAKGRCTDVLVALGDGGDGLELRALEKAREVRRRRGTTMASLRLCAVGAPRSYVVEMRAAAGAGALILRRSRPARR